jgi:plastocyanin
VAEGLRRHRVERRAGDSQEVIVRTAGRGPKTGALLALVVGAMLALALVGTEADAAKHKTKTVTINGSMGSYNFAPMKVKIKKGDSVKWSWNSDQAHNVTFSNKKHSKTKMKLKKYKLTFHKKGTFSYMCTVHFFTGSVVVK